MIKTPLKVENARNPNGALGFAYIIHQFDWRRFEYFMVFHGISWYFMVFHGICISWYLCHGT